MEIKSSLLNDKDFVGVKNSIINISQIDNEDKFRVSLIEYINDSSDKDEDMYFYDMLPFARFLDPSDEATAYTTPDHLIYLNAPGTKVGKNFRQWDFIYDHECLHQLWDTFGVAEKIKKSGTEYNHYVLNIASDCVINDYLYYYRKKDIPDDVITPEYIQKTFGVEYDRKLDTQYDLYLKLIEVKDKLEKDPLCQEINGKIKPKSVKKQNGPTPPPPPQGKHSEDYIKGWTDAIKDVVDKKTNPTDSNYKPKSTGNDEYDAGYNDCMDNIKEGLENGIEVNDNAGGGGASGGSDLPQIPWDTGEENKSSSSSGEGESSDNDSSDSDNNKSPEDSAADAGKSAKSAQDAADAAKNAANKAQEAADEAAENGESNAGEMQKAADKAQDAANKAQAAADKAKEAAKDAADAAQDGDGEGAAEAAKRAEEAAKEAAGAARESADSTRNAADGANENGDSKNGEAANDAADAADAAADTAENSEGKSSNKPSDSNKSDSSQKAGQGHVEGTISDEDLDALRKKAEEIIDKYKNKLAGDLGEFLTKCKISARMEKSGLAAAVTKGVKGWNTELDHRINKYVKQKVFQKKREWKSTYSRVKRGTGYVKQGEPLQPGRRVKEDNMVLNAAFYVDRSGSMGSALNTVFEAAYTICEALKKKYRKEKVIEDIAFKMFAFDDDITPLKFGQRTSLGGGTMSMSKLLRSIEEYSNDYLINIVVTDGYFDINDTEVKNFIKNVNGIVVYVVNRDFPEMEKLAKDLNTKLFFIKADSSFEID